MNMYSDDLMDKLSNVLDNIMLKSEGSWQEKAQFIYEAMKERGSGSNLEEFYIWLQEIY